MRQREQDEMERRTGDDRRQCHLRLEGTYFLERRRPGYDRRNSHEKARAPLFPEVYEAETMKFE